MSLFKLFMVKNVGGRERVLRIILGFFLIAAFFTGHLTELVRILALLFGVVMIITGVTANCAIYSLIGKNSCNTGK